MTSGTAKTVKQYLDELPPERRAVVAAMRTLIRKHLPKGYVEGLAWGAIGYSVPLKVLPDTYNGHPLCYVAIAAQKNYYSLHLMGLYGDAAGTRRLEAAFKKAGKRFDMGKACLRFRSLDDLPLEALSAAIASVPMPAYVARYQAISNRTRSRAST